MNDVTDVTDNDRDLVFVETYLDHEDSDAAAVIACRKAGIIDPHFPIDVVARKTFNRLAPAIKLARKYFQKRQPTEITKDSIIADLEKIFQDSLLSHDHSASNANRKLVAQITGILQNEMTVTHKHDVRLLSDAELEKIAAKGKVIDGVATEILPPGIGHIKVGGEGDDE